MKGPRHGMAVGAGPSFTRALSPTRGEQSPPRTFHEDVTHA